MNGRVTTPTVSAPRSFAILATIGAAPVPVPPPIPHVTKIISAPAKASEICCSLSSAALRPTSGIEPAPNPFVNLGPSWILVSALDAFKACVSVLATMNSTPCTPSSIIRFTALLPAPPTPITLIFAPSFMLESNSNSISFPPISYHSFYIQRDYSNKLLNQRFNFPTKLSS